RWDPPPSSRRPRLDLERSGIGSLRWLGAGDHSRRRAGSLTRPGAVVSRKPGLVARFSSLTRLQTCHWRATSISTEQLFEEPRGTPAPWRRKVRIAGIRNLNGPSVYHARPVLLM